MAQILTAGQAAEKLQMTAEVVRKHLRSGRIPGYKIGRAWRVIDTDLEYYTNNNRRVSALGLCADIPGFSTEEFLKNKREEVEIEEAKFHRTNNP
jgi:excisionase family DNA binding protein